MVQETSVGVVLFRRQTGGRGIPLSGLSLLLLQHPQGHWDFPKGHVEPSESEHETAARELAEETSLDSDRLHWVSGFRYTVTYAYRPPKGHLRVKEVHYLAARTDEESSAVRLSREHIGWGWFVYGGALQQLTHASSRRVLQALVNHLATHPCEGAA